MSSLQRQAIDLQLKMRRDRQSEEFGEAEGEDGAPSARPLSRAELRELLSKRTKEKA